MTVEKAPGDRIMFGDFGDRGSVIYSPPANTLDPRYDACTDHHVACDCREAQFAEYKSEAQADQRLMRETFARHLAGHVVRTFDGSTPCQCSGCRIARDASIWVATAVPR